MNTSKGGRRSKNRLRPQHVGDHLNEHCDNDLKNPAIINADDFDAPCDQLQLWDGAYSALSAVPGNPDFEALNNRHARSLPASRRLNTLFQEALPPGYPIPPMIPSNALETRRVTNKVTRNLSGRPATTNKVPGERVFRQRAETIAPSVAAESDSDDESNDSRPKPQSFKIRDAESVEAFFKDRFSLLQQQADKKIAKVWIRAICPKKQAKWPYSNKHHREEAEEGLPPPPWWPPVGQCLHKEPDHVKARERVNLLIHLIRLRPTPEQIQEWKVGEWREGQPQPPTWTAFLKELTPISLFDDILNEPQQKVDRRPGLLDEIFEVAQAEETFQVEGDDGGIDGDTTISWIPDPEALKKLKQSDEPSTRAKRRAPGSDEASEVGSSELRPKARAKKVRRNPKKKCIVEYKSPSEDTTSVDHAKAASTTSEAAVADSYPEQLQYFHGETPPDSPDQKPESYTHSSLNSSFNSSFPIDDGFTDPWYEPPAELRRHNFACPEVYSFIDYTQPQFQATPNMPILQSTDLASAANTQTQAYSHFGMPRPDSAFAMARFENLRGYGHEMATNQSHQPSSRMVFNNPGFALPMNIFYSNTPLPANVPIEQGRDTGLRYANGLPVEEHTTVYFVSSDATPTDLHFELRGPGNGSGIDRST